MPFVGMRTQWTSRHRAVEYVQYDNTYPGEICVATDASYDIMIIQSKHQSILQQSTRRHNLVSLFFHHLPRQNKI